MLIDITSHMFHTQRFPQKKTKKTTTECYKKTNEKVQAAYFIMPLNMPKVA